MLTGAVLPTSGDAWLGGHNVLTEQAQVRRLIGYCPQHDALLDLLSVREHIELFSAVRGRVVRFRCVCFFQNTGGPRAGLCVLFACPE